MERKGRFQQLQTILDPRLTDANLRIYPFGIGINRECDHMGNEAGATNGLVDRMLEGLRRMERGEDLGVPLLLMAASGAAIPAIPTMGPVPCDGKNRSPTPGGGADKPQRRDINLLGERAENPRRPARTVLATPVRAGDALPGSAIRLNNAVATTRLTGAGFPSRSVAGRLSRAGTAGPSSKSPATTLARRTTAGEGTAPPEGQSR